MQSARICSGDAGAESLFGVLGAHAPGAPRFESKGRTWERGEHLGDSFLYARVLPHPDHAPAGLPERATDQRVALDIAIQLGLPVGTVHLWRHAVRETAVPEATVDEDRHLRLWENDVGPDP